MGTPHDTSPIVQVKKRRHAGALAPDRRAPVKARVIPPGPMCQARTPMQLDDGTMCLAPMSYPGATGSEPRASVESNESQDKAVLQQGIDNICKAVDRLEELRGSGIIIRLPVGDPIQVRDSKHASGLDTYVVATAIPGQPGDDRSWWEKHNGIVLNCGGAALSWAGVAVGAAAELPSGGTSTILLVATYSSATATTAQCGLAVAKEASPAFQEYVAGPDGKWVDYADIVLDVISLAGGVGSAAAAAKSGSTLLKTSKYAAALEQLPKGQLVKTLDRLEKAGKDLEEVRALFNRAVQFDARIGSQAGRAAMTNNALKRALPLITGRLNADIFNGLASAVSAALSMWSSYCGGVGQRSWGVMKWAVSVYQESLDSPDNSSKPK